MRNVEIVPKDKRNELRTVKVPTTQKKKKKGFLSHFLGYFLFFSLFD
ncbi:MULTISPECIES: hypothetical protein [Flavobacteriaceae]|nr:MULTISPECIES: hypothetical protein [Flavobacteriaceae]NJB38144.1 hypothetical protein [Croceivirga sp. JEA036]